MIFESIVATRVICHRWPFVGPIKQTHGMDTMTCLRFPGLASGAD